VLMDLGQRAQRGFEAACPRHKNRVVATGWIPGTGVFRVGR